MDKFLALFERIPPTFGILVKSSTLLPLILYIAPKPSEPIATCRLTKAEAYSVSDELSYASPHTEPSLLKGISSDVTAISFVTSVGILSLFNIFNATGLGSASSAALG